MNAKIKVFDLGWCMGKLRIDTYQLNIMSPSDSDAVHQPAESIVIYGRENLHVLRDILNEVYPPDDKVTQAATAEGKQP